MNEVRKKSKTYTELINILGKYGTSTSNAHCGCQVILKRYTLVETWNLLIMT